MGSIAKSIHLIMQSQLKVSMYQMNNQPLFHQDQIDFKFINEAQQIYKVYSSKSLY